MDRALFLLFWKYEIEIKTIEWVGTTLLLFLSVTIFFSGIANSAWDCLATTDDGWLLNRG